MSVIKEILEQLKTATHPIARAIHKGHDFKTLVLGFKSAMILKDHKAHMPSKLTVLSGSVIYREGDQETKLAQYEEYDIPVEVMHSVEALEDSLCLLTQG
jgi:quercetin dioxygenase-like cupin family protein